jgi:hypothetical protein
VISQAGANQYLEFFSKFVSYQGTALAVPRAKSVSGTIFKIRLVSGHGFSRAAPTAK